MDNQGKTLETFCQALELKEIKKTPYAGVTKAARTPMRLATSLGLCPPLFSIDF